MDPVVVACGLQSTGSATVMLGLHCPTTPGIPPPDQDQTGAPALQSGFLTTRPQEAP